MEVINYKGRKYPAFQASGFAARFVFPFAKEVCKGIGYDIGCNREEWKLPSSRGIDKCFYDDYDAMNLPDPKVDYIFSSHCLEHINDWVGALDYWITKLRASGVLFLYLPHPDQEYWLPWNNRKHLHVLYPDVIRHYLEERFINVFVSDRDLNHSFVAVASNKIIE